MLVFVCRPWVLITLSYSALFRQFNVLLGLNFCRPWVLCSDNYVSMFLLGLDFSLQLNLSDQRRCVHLQISNHVAGIALCSNIRLHCIVHPDWRLVKYFLTISERGISKCEGGVVWWWWWFHHNRRNQWAVVSGSAGRREWCIVAPSDTRWRHLVGITHLPIQSPPPSPSPLPSNKHWSFSINI